MDYQKMDEKFAAVNKLLMEADGKGALAKLNELGEQGVLLPEEMWRFYQRMGDCYFSMLEIEKAAEAYWQCITSTEGLPLIKQQEIFSNYLFILHYRDNIGDKEFAAKHLLYDQLFVRNAHYNHTPRRRAKIRVGYIADKFVMNVVSFFAIQLMTAYDKEKFEVYVYSISPEEDRLTEQLRQYVTAWKSFPVAALTMEKAALIKEDEIDILFDLSVHTFGGRTLQIMSYKPAPIQMAGIGYMSTTGLKAVDYFLTDVYLDPWGEHDDDFCEHLLRLPHSHFCYTPPERSLTRRTDWQLHTPIVFASFNNFAKISNEMLVLWKRILDAVPGAKILLKNSTQKSWYLKNIEKRVCALGYRKEQYVIEGSTHEYFDRYMDVDIILDTYPYEGGSTTCDALFCGVPVITMEGHRHSTRFGYSLLMNVGLGELAAKDRADYFAKAVALANNPAKLCALHEMLPKCMRQSPLMDNIQYVRSIEAEYIHIYEQWLQDREEAGEKI